MSQPIKNAPFTFNVSGLKSQSTSGFQTNPTLEAGDVKLSKDDGSFADLETLPTVVDGSTVLSVSLSADEMNCDRIVVRFSDVDGDEWGNTFARIQTIVDSQQAILNKLSKPTVVYSQPDSCSKITIRKGDAYDGVSWPIISQDAGKDVDGKATRLVIFKTSDPDTLIVDATDTGDGQLVQVPLTSAETELLERSVENDDYSYRLSVTHQADSVQSWQGIAKII